MSDEQQIRDLVTNWLAASKSGDTATVLSLMTDDVVFMTPGREPFGKQAFANQSAQMKNVQIEAKANIQEIKVLGDWAWMRNHLEIKITPPNSDPITKKGHILTILKKNQEGRWQIHRDANLLS
jgi:uncharacterized protein (TIGR02246 family)